MQKFRRGVVSVVWLAVLSTFHASPVRAQSASTGTVSGQVMDRQSAVIVGAQVTLTDTSTNTVQSTSTNETGRYV
ncbi:MAG: carboxypeptidase-like regulatory domain-containing protein, partial [Candidatus Sulfotelmatobacter sp.]